MVLTKVRILVRRYNGVLCILSQPVNRSNCNLLLCGGQGTGAVQARAHASVPCLVLHPLFPFSRINPGCASRFTHQTTGILQKTSQTKTVRCPQHPGCAAGNSFDTSSGLAIVVGPDGPRLPAATANKGQSKGLVALVYICPESQEGKRE